VLGICLAATVACVWGAGDRDLWLDEGVSVALARSGADPFAISLAGSETNMSLYFAALRVWMLLGSSEAWVRGLSAVFAVAAIPLLYDLARRLFDPRAGLIAAALFAANAMVLTYAQEARAYTLLLLLVVASTNALVRAREQDDRFVWAVWGFLAGLAMWAHIFGGFTVVAQVVALLLSRPGTLSRPLVGLGACAITAGPLLAITVGHGNDLIGWIPRPKLSAIPYAFGELAGATSVAPLAWATLAVAVLTVVVDRSWGTALAVSLLVVPLLGAYLVSLVSAPVFVIRYLIGALPGLMLLLGAGLARVRWLGALLTVVLVLTGVLLVDARPPREAWRSVTTDVVAASRPGDGIAFFHPAGQTLFDYYADGRGPVSVFPALGADETLFDEHTSILVPLAAADAQAAVAAHDRIWIIYSHAGSMAQQRLVFRTELARQRFQPELERQYDGILVVLFVRTRPWMERHPIG
jgi:mannosyltransferase